MAILVIAEHHNASIKAATLNTVAAAAKIGGDVHVLIAGYNAQVAADATAKSRRRRQGTAGRPTATRSGPRGKR